MTAKPQAQMIAPDAYPQMMTGKDVAQAMATLRSAQTEAKAQGAMNAAAPPMRPRIDAISPASHPAPPAAPPPPAACSWIRPAAPANQS